MSSPDEPMAVPPQRSNWSRYSLRSLLALMLVAGLLLGWIGIRQQAKRRQRAIVEELAPFGGDALYRHGNVVQVAFYGQQFRDESLRELTRLPHLKRLVLIDTPVTDSAFVQVSRLVQITDLVLLNARGVTDAALPHIRGLMQLRTLRLTNTHITDQGLQHLKHLSRLEQLDLIDTEVTDAGLVHLQGLQKLKTLLLHGTRVTQKGVEELQRELPKTSIVGDWQENSN